MVRQMRRTRQVEDAGARTRARPMSPLVGFAVGFAAGSTVGSAVAARPWSPRLGRDLARGLGRGLARRLGRGSARGPRIATQVGLVRLPARRTRPAGP